MFASGATINVVVDPNAVESDKGPMHRGVSKMYICLFEDVDVKVNCTDFEVNFLFLSSLDDKLR
jgi:hypothetical protein